MAKRKLSENNFDLKKMKFKSEIDDEYDMDWLLRNKYLTSEFEESCDSSGTEEYARESFDSFSGTECGTESSDSFSGTECGTESETECETESATECGTESEISI